MTTVLAAWIAATGASTATVSLPEGCTSNTVIEPGKPGHLRTGAMDSQGNWYFAETSGPDNLTTIRMVKTREATEHRGAPVVFADKIEGISGTTGGGMVVHDESPSVRMAAAIALERLGSPEVTTFVDDPDPAVSKEAARAAHTLGLAPAPPPDQPSSSTNQPVTPAESDIHPAAAGTNPWLYIVIGMLVVTGVLLYVDPRIF